MAGLKRTGRLKGLLGFAALGFFSLSFLAVFFEEVVFRLLEAADAAAASTSESSSDSISSASALVLRFLGRGVESLEADPRVVGSAEELCCCWSLAARAASPLVSFLNPFDDGEDEDGEAWDPRTPPRPGNANPPPSGMVVLGGGGLVAEVGAGVD